MTAPPPPQDSGDNIDQGAKRCRPGDGRRLPAGAARRQDRRPGVDTRGRAVTTETRGNFIGGEWREVADGGTDAVLDPATGDMIAEVASSTTADVDRAVEAAAAAFHEWAAARPASGRRRCGGSPTGWRRRRDELIALESRNVGKPIAAVPEEIDFDIDNLRFFAGAARTADAQVGGRVHGRLHVDPAPRAARRGGLDRAVELPADDGGLEDRAGAGGRQHGRAEAVRADAAHRPAARRAGRRPAAAGGAQRRHRPGRARRRGPLVPPRRGDRLASRARSPPARRSCAPRPTRSSASTSSSAARRRWWSSTTPTWTRPSRP